MRIFVSVILHHRTDLITRQHTIKRAPIDIQDAGGRRNVAFGELQDVTDVTLFYLFKAGVSGKLNNTAAVALEGNLCDFCSRTSSGKSSGVRIG